jgi:hypothetical protein
LTGTAQSPPGTGSVTVWHLEDGFQTTIPAAQQRLYTGHENDRAPVPAVTATVRTTSGDPSMAPPSDQATQVRNALPLACCQPAVGAFFDFELFDEHRLAGWPSGLLYADGSAKPSCEPFKQTIATVDAGQVDCTQVPGAAG